jgi:hypothetical protein
MKRLLASLLATMTIAHAQTIPPIVYDIEANFQQTQELPDQEFVQGAGVVLRYRLRSAGRWLDLGGLGARWDARAAATNTSAYQATATVVTNTTPNYFQITLNSDQTGSAVADWVYSLIITFAGTDYAMGQGRLDIAASAWTGASAIMTNVTAATYTDAAVAAHAAVAATTNSLGHVIIGSGISVDSNGVISAASATLDLQDVTDNGATTTNIVQVAALQLDTNYTNGTAEGRLQWNDDEGTLEFGKPGGSVNLQIGQETLFRARNVSGADILDGTPVAIVQSAGNPIAIVPARADAAGPTNIVDGVATETIAAGQQGYATAYGLVRGVDTSAFGEGVRLYLGAAGGYTDVPGTYEIGTVAVSGNSGSVLVSPSSAIPSTWDYTAITNAPWVETDSAASFASVTATGDVTAAGASLTNAAAKADGAAQLDADNVFAGLTNSFEDVSVMIVSGFAFGGGADPNGTYLYDDVYVMNMFSMFYSETNGYWRIQDADSGYNANAGNEPYPHLADWGGQGTVIAGATTIGEGGINAHSISLTGDVTATGDISYANSTPARTPAAIASTNVVIDWTSSYVSYTGTAAATVSVEANPGDNKSRYVQLEINTTNTVIWASAGHLVYDEAPTIKRGTVIYYAPSFGTNVIGRVSYDGTL